MKKSLLNAINNISSTEELNAAIDLIKIKQKQLRAITSAEKRATFSPGDHVVINSRKGRMTGIVSRVKRTKAVVDIDSVSINDDPNELADPRKDGMIIIRDKLLQEFAIAFRFHSPNFADITT